MNVSDTIEWLVGLDNPSVRYRTLKELLGCDEGEHDVARARSVIPESKPVRQLLDTMHPDGYWLQKNPRTQVVVGDGVEYGAFGTTHFCLAYLGELGMDRTHPQVARAAERYLALQQLDGDWLRHFSCLIGYNIRTFVRLGYREDARVKRAVELLLGTDREDGGYLCDIHEGKYKTKSVKSCIRGSVKALMAFAELPECWEQERCKRLVDYFLRRGGIFQTGHPGKPVNYDMERMSFPITWRTNVWEVLYALSKMGYGLDERLQEAWGVLEEKATLSGRYRLDWTPAQSPWKVGSRGKENKWVTLYVLLAEKHRNQSPDVKGGAGLAFA